MFSFIAHLIPWKIELKEMFSSFLGIESRVER